MADSDLVDLDCGETPNKRRRIKQRFRSDWTSKWSFIRPSQKGDDYAFCTICTKDLSIHGGGGNDIKHHVDRDSHKKNARAVNTTPKLDFSQKDTLEKKVTRAELYFTDFLVEHNVSLAASDHAGDWFKKVFPDSEISKRYACKRTKTHSLVKLLGENEQENIVSNIKESVFCIATDGSNDIRDCKLYPVLARYFNTQQQKVVTALLSIRQCKVWVCLSTPCL